MGEIGLSGLERQIRQAEKELDERQLAIERAKEKIIKSERVKKFKGKNIKDLSFNDIEQMKEDGIYPDDFPKPVGSIPDVSGLYSKILSNLKQILEMRGYQVYLKPMKSLIDVRDNIFAIRDSLKQNTEPVITETGYDEDEFKSYGDVFAKQDIKQSEFVIDYDIDGIASKGDTLIIKNDGSWERRPKYTKAELIRVKQEVDAILRSYT